MKRSLLISIILALLLVAAALCGCSGEGSGPAESAAPSAEPTPTPTADVPDAAEAAEKMRPHTENGQYIYNFYALSDEALALEDEGFAAFYVSFVDAYLSYENTIACPSRSYAYTLVSVINREFPVFVADGQMDSLFAYDPETETVSWSYTSSKAEHDSVVKEFAAQAQLFLDGVRDDQSDQYKAQKIYHNLCPTLTYDYEGLETKKNIEPYYVYMQHSGVCFSFAGAYSQLLTQVGIKSTEASGQSNFADIPHAWTVLCIDGENYFCDPTYEITVKSGTVYAYYGMNLDMRLNGGEYTRDQMFVGRYNTLPVDEYGDFSKTLQILDID